MAYDKFIKSPPLAAGLPPIYAFLAARSLRTLPEGPELIEQMLLNDEEALGDTPPPAPVLIVW